MKDKKVFVSISLNRQDISVGVLWFHVRGLQQKVSFEYTKDWLHHPECFALAPNLKLTKGAFHMDIQKGHMAGIGDSSPDRWGRLLMHRNASMRAQGSPHPPHTLTESDYLLGVNDEARQGALRFQTKEGGPFLSPSSKGAIPPLVNLSRLLISANRVLDDNAGVEDLKLLLSPGSSLGGARPKAVVYNNQGELSIAKFPRKDDTLNIVLWEATALQLAKQAQIDVPQWGLENSAKVPILLLKRFDRCKQVRIPFLSAMSLLEARDHQPHCYVEIAYAIMQNSLCPQKDLAQLWRRMVFNILVSNVDDHLRNHGFLYVSDGWQLSPAYDINPTPSDIHPHTLTTAIGFDTTETSLEKAFDVIEDFRLSKKEACHILKEVSQAVSTWRETAKKLGLSKHEIDRMESAFEHSDSHKAQKI